MVPCHQQVLLRAGADVNQATTHGTALHAAASRCCHRSVYFLLQRWAPACMGCSTPCPGCLFDNPCCECAACCCLQRCTRAASAALCPHPPVGAPIHCYATALEGQLLTWQR